MKQGAPAVAPPRSPDAQPGLLRRGRRGHGAPRQWELGMAFMFSVGEA